MTATETISTGSYNRLEYRVIHKNALTSWHTIMVCSIVSFNNLGHFCAIGGNNFRLHSVWDTRFFFRDMGYCD